MKAAMLKLYRAHNLSLGFPAIGTFVDPYQVLARRPLSMPRWLHEAADEWFLSSFGTRFRSRALFASGNLNQAAKYLDADRVMLTVWPIGDYRLCFSLDVYDLFDTLVSRFSSQDASAHEVKAELGLLGYQCFHNCGLELAVASQCEVMLVAPEYGYEIVQVSP